MPVSDVRTGGIAASLNPGAPAPRTFAASSAAATVTVAPMMTAPV
jgi:hypothetical protein